MAQPIRSKSLDRRQLLTSAAGVVAAGILPGTDQTQAVNSTEAVCSASTPALEIPALNVCAATARRLAQIAERDRIRKEAGLPLLSITKELRRMKTAADAAEFEAFAAVHRAAVWKEVLAPERERRGDPAWRPRTFTEGLAFQAEVNKILHQRYRRITTANSDRAPNIQSSVNRGDFVTFTKRLDYYLTFQTDNPDLVMRATIGLCVIYHDSIVATQCLCM
jgi:hypothetical protein